MAGKRQHFFFLLFVIILIVILWVTVFGRSTISDDPFKFRPFHSFQSIMIKIKLNGLNSNFFGNILLFLPVGFLFEATFNLGWKKIISRSFCLSLLIELLQLILRKGYFEIDDLICNTLGSAIGYVIFTALYKVLRQVICLIII